MGQGAHHLGVSLAPAADNSSWAGASCASSLPAGAGVVTMRLAQDFCRCYAGTVAAANVTTRAAMIIRGEVAACMSHVGASGAGRFYLKQMLPLGQWSRGVPHAIAGEVLSRPRRLRSELRQNGRQRWLGDVRT